jgi:hypothetical protein
MCKFTDTKKADVVPTCSSDTLEFVGGTCRPKPGGATTTGTTGGTAGTTTGTTTGGTETQLMCPDGTVATGDKCFDKSDTGIPPNVCRASATLKDGMCVEDHGDFVSSMTPSCPTGTMLMSANKCMRYTIAQCPTGYNKQILPPGRVKCVKPLSQSGQTTTIGGSTTTTGTNATGGSTTTTGTNSTSQSNTSVTPASVRKNTILGPVFTSYGAPITPGNPDSYKTTKYPELLGGGDPAARNRESGAGGRMNIDLQGSLPTMDGLGATEASKYFPFSRQPGDMELIPDPYRVSQQFSSASYSFKTEPTPFLTDFSAFLR